MSVCLSVHIHEVHIWFEFTATVFVWLMLAHGKLLVWLHELVRLEV